MTMENRGLSTLVVGFILIALGGLFLAVNLTSFEVDWITLLKLVLPALFVFGGALKLYRHFAWTDEELLARPGKAGLLGGLFWFFFGLLLLLDIFDVLETIRFFGLYWPVLIIIFGLGKIVDYYRLRGKLQFRTGEIFGVVFIVVFGFACNQLADAHFGVLEDLGWSSKWPSVDLSSERFEYRVEQSVELEGIERIEIKNVYGDLTVESAPDILQIELTKIIGAETERESSQLSDDVEIIATREANTLTVQTNREALGSRGKKLTTNLKLGFPKEIPLIVKNGFGEVSVTRREADCEIENSYGEVSVEEIAGSVSIVNQYAPVNVRSVDGVVAIKNRRAPVSVRGVTGDLEMVTDHDEMRIRDIGGQIKAENEYGEVRLSGAAGPVQVIAPGSSVRISKAKGPVSVRSSHKDVRIEEVQDRLDVETSYGEVRLSRISGVVHLTAVQSEVIAEQLEAGALIQGRGSEVSLSETTGKITVETSLRRVSIREFTGPVEVQNEFAEIFLQPASPLADSILAVNKNGDITLVVPESANFNLSAQVTDGEIHSDFGPAQEGSEGKIAFLESKIGNGGPSVELQTTYASIRIKKT